MPTIHRTAREKVDAVVTALAAEFFCDICRRRAVYMFNMCTRGVRTRIIRCQEHAPESRGVVQAESCHIEIL